MPPIHRSFLAPMAIALGLLAGCTALPGHTPASGTSTSAKKATTPAKSKAPAGRTVQIDVLAPVEMAEGGKVVATGGAALFDKGGGLVAAGAGNLVAAGAGNLVAAGAGNLVAAGGGNLQAPAFRLLADDAPRFAPVTGGGLQLVGQDGKAAGAAVELDDKGHATVKNVADGKPLTALAAFQVGEKVYRLAVVVPAGKTDKGFVADPINTMVEARVRGILGTSGQVPALTYEKLARVWTICNDAGVTVKKEDLEAGDDDTVKATLDRVWQEAIDAKVTSTEQKAEIKAFMAELKAATEAKK